MPWGRMLYPGTLELLHEAALLRGGVEESIAQVHVFWLTDCGSEHSVPLPTTPPHGLFDHRAKYKEQSTFYF